MVNLRQRARIKKPRIVLTDRDLEHLFEINGTDSAAVLAKRTGLPYILVYNLIHRRVWSVSNRYYQTLFGRPAPQQGPLKVDGAMFRAMADLWLFLNDRITKADLYRELFAVADNLKIDHRIFSGRINTVDGRIEHIMRRKFEAAGVDAPLLAQWIAEFESLQHDDWVPYDSLRSSLMYLEDKLGVHPTSVLNQSVARYETGMLKRVSRSTADRVEALKRKTEKALLDGGKKGIEAIRESILGGKPGYTLYTDIKEELLFLRRTTKKGVKNYLGRSLWAYENGKAKRIANWRAREIRKDCERVIRQSPAIALASLPSSLQNINTRRLISVLIARSTQLLLEKEGIDFEKRILKPMHGRDEYARKKRAFTPFDMAPGVLGMKRKAFDMMVAKNCEIFRSVGKYSQRWYLPDLYLRELSGKKDFGLILAKYEVMAKKMRSSRQTDTCMR